MDFGSRSCRKRALIRRKHNTISVAKQCIRVTYVPITEHTLLHWLVVQDYHANVKQAMAVGILVPGLKYIATLVTRLPPQAKQETGSKIEW